MRLSFDRRRATLRASLSGAHPLAWRAAALRMTREAYVLLERRGREQIASLRPKRRASLAALAARFERAYERERPRWPATRAERARQAEVLRRALSLGEAGGARPAPAAALAPEQEREIAALLAEAEAAPKDPLGIAASWRAERP